MMRTRAHAAMAMVSLIILLSPFSLAAHENEAPSGFDYRASLRTASGQAFTFERESFDIEITIENTGRTTWKNEGRTPCYLSYHLLDEQKKTIRFDNPRCSLPRKIKPGDSLALPVRIRGPFEEGNYFLEFDLLLEGLFWFKDRGSITLLHPLRVSPRQWPEDDYVLTLEDGAFTKIDSNLPEFNALLKLIRITLKHNEVSFPGKTGLVRGFSAGTDYPQIWLRDANSTLPASRYFYPAPYLISWLDEHLAFQQPDGSLFDWLDSRGVTDKNTVATDQEASAVQAARQAAEICGQPWAASLIHGRLALERLEDALDFVLRTRFSAKFGLITGAHTADWGDVDMNRPDQRAVDVDESTHWTADIYDQSMFYEAASDLALLFENASLPGKADPWRATSERIRKNADKWLWQENKGFYRIHIHLDSLRHDFQEDDIFAAGGNSQAMISGLAGLPEENKGMRILEQALARQKSFGLSTVSGSLLPPFPKGLFKHPALDEPFEYQNGGQWDWFGAKLILEMFKRGFSRPARDKLREIARKNIANGCLYEWDTKDGSGRGSEYFSGSAGSLARALFEGYFGIRASRSRVDLSPRLGMDEARIHVYLPAAGRFVAYDYKILQKEKTIRFDVNSNFPGQSSLRILMPWTVSDHALENQGQTAFEVTRDGAKIPFRLERLHEDTSLVLETDLKKRSIVIRFLRS